MTGLKDGWIARQTSVCAGSNWGFFFAVKCARQTSVCVCSNWGFFLRLSMLAKHRFVFVATGDFFAVMLANTLFGMVATGDFLSKHSELLG